MSAKNGVLNHKMIFGTIFSNNDIWGLIPGKSDGVTQQASEKASLKFIFLDSLYCLNGKGKRRAHTKEK